MEAIAGVREAAERFLQLHPESMAAHSAVGHVCERERDYAAAEKHYREALRRERIEAARR